MKKALLFFILLLNFSSIYPEIEQPERLVISSSDSLKAIVNMQAQELTGAKETIEFQKQQFDGQNSARNIIVVFISLFLSIFFLLYNRYQLKQNNKYQSKINQQQNDLFTNMFSIQDKERKRFAEDLHDGLGSVLSTIKLNLERMQEEKLELSPEQKTKYLSSLDLLDNAIEELRNISHNIMPASLSKLGLVSALKNLFDSISSHSGLQINFSTHDLKERLDESHEMSIYRIILELLNNIVKHAKAKEITIQLVKYSDYINISVEDNGVGFDHEKIKKDSKGIGLANISSRVDVMGGKINFDSSEGSGTTVQIDIPLNIV